MNYKEIYQKYYDGAYLTNKEILYGEQHFKRLAEELFKLGPVFRASAKELNWTYIGLYDYRVARGLKELNE